MARSDVLVSADWAQSNLDADHVVFVEVDEDTSAYDDGHIAGAVKLDWRTDLQDPVRRDFVDAQQFSKLLSERGIANGDTVVLYGGNNNWFAAYAYWYFKLYGHEDVKLLDGGRKKWQLDGRAFSTESVDRPATSYTAKPADNSIRAFRDEVLAAISEKNLVDVRPRRVLRQDPGAGPSAAGAEPTARPHPGRDQRAVEQDRQRRRHLQVRRRVGQELCRRGIRRGEGNDCLLPNRGTFVAHLVRLAGITRASRTSRTTTAVGPNTAPWWGPRSSWEADYVLCAKARTDSAGQRRPGEGNSHHGPRGG